MLKVNGKSLPPAPITKKGYAKIRRTWMKGDTIELTLSTPVERIEAHPKVRADCGRVALERGPLVYCLEEADNGPDLHDITLPRNAQLKAAFDSKLLGGVTVIRGKALRRRKKGWKGTLYRRTRSGTQPVSIKAIPYCLWGNRGPGEMLVWMRQI
jgi:DUF1680 family protein